MGQFQDISFPIERFYITDMASGLLAPDVAVSSTPGGKAEQRIALAAEGRYVCSLTQQNREVADAIAVWNFYLGVGGVRDSFRLRDPDSALSAGIDEALGGGDGVKLAFQLLRSFGSYTHTITKPAAGTVVPKIAGVIQTTRLSVNASTGLLTFSANLTGAITGATSANPCVLTKTAHGLNTGDSVRLSTFTGAWAALNGTRQVVTRLTANTFSIPVNATAFAAYAGNGGAFNTIPQTGEAVAASFTHDWQVRFSGPLTAPVHPVPGYVQRLPVIELVEVSEA
jgi:uncharacterized protein (TIGR02217 family)